jgi:hypothetical protein
MAPEYPVTFGDLVEFLVLTVSLPLTGMVLVAILGIWFVELGDWLHERKQRQHDE